MKPARAFAKIGNGNTFGNFHHSVTYFLHDAANSATSFIGAGTFFVETVADAAYRSQRAFNMTDDGCDGDLVGAPRKPVAPGNAALAANDAGGFQVIEDLFEKALGDILLVGDGLDADQRFVVVKAKHEQGAQSVFSTH